MISSLLLWIKLTMFLSIEGLFTDSIEGVKFNFLLSNVFVFFIFDLYENSA